MASQGRQAPRDIYRVVAVIFAWLLISPALAANPRSGDAPENWRTDAGLNCIHFIDAAHGCAVGDRGTIWQTVDGGKNWVLQPSGAHCQLNSACLTDAANGWIAGGDTQPYTHTSTGLLLRTRDGGQHWTPEPKLTLPSLARMGQLADGQCWAVGASSAMFPLAAFIAPQTGRDWSPLAGREFGDFAAADFSQPQTGTLVDTAGRVWCARRRAVEPAELPAIGLRRAQAVKLNAYNSGWLVGDGGLVLRTADAGTHWQAPPQPLPGEAAVDLRAVATVGEQCWLAGSPGDKIFSTADGGKTWATFGTGQSLPINALTFVDARHGWAAGALGAILATDDGGRTWRRQRGGQTSAALLAVFAEPADLPLELLARTSAADGYISAATIVTRRDVDDQTGVYSRDRARTREALAELGVTLASDAWQFPLRQRGLQASAAQVAAGWDQADGQPGSEQRLERMLVQQICQWRPEVIVTHDPARRDDAAGQLIADSVLRAVAAAAQPNNASGLPAWTVKKVFAALAPGQVGPISVNASQVAPRLGRSLADLTSRAHGLLDEQYQPPPATLGFRVLESHLPQASGQGDFFTGLNIAAGSTSRRAVTEVSGDGVEGVRRAALERRNLQAILTQTAAANPAQMLSQIGNLVSGLDANTAGELLYQLGQRFHQSGQWDLAAQTFELLAARYPDHALTPAATLWLVQFYSSGEARHRLSAQQKFTVKQAGGQVEIKSRPSFMPLDDNTSGSVRGQSTEATRAQQRFAAASRLSDQLRRTQPALSAEPQVGFAWAAALRQAGQTNEADKLVQQLSLTRPHDAWWLCAQGEPWLISRRGPAPKSVCRCGTHGVRPTLDAVLDDPIWKAATRLELRTGLGDDGDWPAVAMLAGDEEYLYLAVTCRHAPGAAYPPAIGKRTRDADLTRSDRVDLLLDVDRDFATYYRLTVDYRGWTRESCWGDLSWNPNWFVAAATKDNVWTIEAAIPWEELTPSGPPTGQAWTLGVQRTVPGAGLQSWTTPAATQIVPEGFGYLLFE